MANSRASKMLIYNNMKPTAKMVKVVKVSKKKKK